MFKKKLLYSLVSYYFFLLLCSFASPENPPEDQPQSYGWVTDLDSFLPTDSNDRRWGWTEDFQPQLAKNGKVDDIFSLENLHRWLQNSMTDFDKKLNGQDDRNRCCGALTFVVKNDKGGKRTYYTYALSTVQKDTFFKKGNGTKNSNKVKKIFFTSGSDQKISKDPENGYLFGSLFYGLEVLYNAYQDRLSFLPLSENVAKKKRVIQEKFEAYKKTFSAYVKEQLERELPKDEIWDHAGFSSFAKRCENYHEEALIQCKQNNGSLFDSEQFLLYYLEGLYGNDFKIYPFANFYDKKKSCVIDTRENLEIDMLTLKATALIKENPQSINDFGCEQEYFSPGTITHMIISVHSRRELCEVCAASFAGFLKQHPTMGQYPELIITTSSQEDIAHDGSSARSGGIGGDKIEGDDFCRNYGYKNIAESSFIPQKWLGPHPCEESTAPIKRAGAPPNRRVPIFL